MAKNENTILTEREQRLKTRFNNLRRTGRADINIIKGDGNGLTAYIREAYHDLLVTRQLIMMTPKAKTSFMERLIRFKNILLPSDKSPIANHKSHA